MESHETSHVFGKLSPVLYFSRFSGKFAWLSRYPICITVGFGTGYSIIPSLKTRIMLQLYGTVVDPTGEPLLSAKNIGVFFKDPSFKTFFYDALMGPLLVLGVFVVIVHFFFSLKNNNRIVRFSRNPALLFLMIAFGASFGYTFMGRISLFVGRMTFIFQEWWPIFKSTIGG